MLIRVWPEWPSHELPAESLENSKLHWTPPEDLKTFRKVRVKLLPSLEERWYLDLYPGLNVSANSTASRPGGLSLSRHYGRSVGKDHSQDHRPHMEPKVADFDIVIRDGLNVERHFQVWESTRPGSRLNQIQLPG